MDVNSFLINASGCKIQGNKMTLPLEKDLQFVALLILEDTKSFLNTSRSYSDSLKAIYLPKNYAGILLIIH